MIGSTIFEEALLSAKSPEVVSLVGNVLACLGRHHA
jgi:hypothetical protein